jgi:hypothetical protein
VASGPPRSRLGIGVALVAYPLVVIAAALVGKAAGIMVGRWRHRRLRRQLSHRMADLLSMAER